MHPIFCCFPIALDFLFMILILFLIYFLIIILCLVIRYFFSSTLDFHILNHSIFFIVINFLDYFVNQFLILICISVFNRFIDSTNFFLPYFIILLKQFLINFPNFLLKIGLLIRRA